MAETQEPEHEGVESGRVLIAVFGDRLYHLDAEPKVRDLIDDEEWADMWAWKVFSEPPDHGMWVWEGDCIIYDDGSPYFEPLTGTYRPLTDEEWARLRDGKAPWDE